MSRLLLLRSAAFAAPAALAAVTVLVTAIWPRTARSSPPEPAEVPGPRPAHAPGLVVGRANGADYVALLGRHAEATLAPNSGVVGALVAIPKGKRAADYGLEEVVPGVGRLRAPPARIEAFGFAHRELRLEVAPPLHPLLDRAGQWVRADRARRERAADGTGVLVGVADTGLDVTNPEMVDANGKSRVAWLLDLSLRPAGVYPELEKKYGILDPDGTVTGGAVLDKTMIDALLAKIKSGACAEKDGTKCAPSDEIGHGTHVTGIAASRGAGGRYPGIAPAADIVFVRVARGRNDSIENDDLVRAVQFMFNRADA